MQNWMSKSEKTNLDWQFWEINKINLDLLKNYCHFYNLIRNFNVKY